MSNFKRVFYRMIDFWEIIIRKCILTPITLIIIQYYCFSGLGNAETIYYEKSSEIQLNYQKYEIKPYYTMFHA